MIENTLLVFFGVLGVCSAFLAVFLIVEEQSRKD